MAAVGGEINVPRSESGRQSKCVGKCYALLPDIIAIDAVGAEVGNKKMPVVGRYARAVYVRCCLAQRVGTRTAELLAVRAHSNRTIGRDAEYRHRTAAVVGSNHLFACNGNVAGVGAYSVEPLNVAEMPRSRVVADGVYA